MTDFAVGDKVRVLCRSKLPRDKYPKAGDPVFGIPYPVYDQMVNYVYTVRKVDACTVSFDDEKYGLPPWFPCWALELVEKAPSESTSNIKPRWPFSDSVSVLGAVYSIQQKTEEQEPRLKGLDGFVDWTTKTIVLRGDVEGDLGHMDEYAKKVLRHEITHAFINESGLSDSAENGSWATSEEAVDWIAWQGPKLVQAWKEAGCM